MATSELVAELRATLSVADAVRANPFRVLKGIAAVLAAEGASSTASELVLRAFDQRDSFVGYEEILDSLARHTGYFPYIDPSNLSEKDLLAYEFHRPLDLDDHTVFHRVQAEVYRYLLDGDNVILSAPTSFGKSRIIDAMIATNRYKNIAIIVPTLALIDETRKRLAAFRDKYKLVTHLSQRPAERNLFVLTAERALAYNEMPSIDFFVIDEFYKLGAFGEGDRMVALNAAFYRLRKSGGQFYLLGPNVRQLPSDTDGQLNARVIVTNFSTVLSEQVRLETSGPDVAKLVELCRELDDRTIIYCSSPGRVNEVAGALVDSQVTQEQTTLAGLVDWASTAFHPDWTFCRAVSLGIGIHHGHLPRSLAQHVVKLFNDEQLKFLVCTSTLIEGVNTKAKNVVIYDNEIARQKIDFFTFNNIKGRSGRMFEHFVGHVYLFSDPPDPELPFVDLPFLTQDELSPASLLVQLDDADLKPRARVRLQSIVDQNVLPIEVIRENAAVDPEAQVSLARRLEGLSAALASRLAWSGMPRYKQLLFACELIWEFFVSGRRRQGVSSASQLTFLTWSLQQRESVGARIRNNLTGRFRAASVDEAVERVLRFDRNLAGFELPRFLMCLSRIQQSVLGRRGLPVGNYSFYSARLESLFRPPVIGALDEYGVPPSLGEKIVAELGTEDDLDAAIAALKRLDVSRLRITEYERKMLEQVIPEL